MSKHASPLLGYNNNVRHKNRVFHIQTEDSGVKHPHIITHLFMDGGRILKSVKRSYAEHVGADGMHDIVKQMMKEQHKAMFIALRDGQFDHLLEGATPAKDAPKSDAKAGDAKAGAAEAKGGDAAKEPAPKVEAKKPAMPPAKVDAPAIVSAPAPPSAPAHGASARTDPAPPPSSTTADDAEMVPMTTRNPPLTLDIEALDRAARAEPAGIRPQSDLPPPPANLFREKSASSGAYRSVPPAAPVAEAKQPSAPPPKKPPSNAPKKNPQSEGRYAAARPAAIFGQARPQQGSSIFGEDLISDKSLDEVILSYLAEDLDPAADAKKK